MTCPDCNNFLDNQGDCACEDIPDMICPKCGSTDNYDGYGFAAGGLSSYTICECGNILQRIADTEGLPKEIADKEKATNIIYKRSQAVSPAKTKENK